MPAYIVFIRGKALDNSPMGAYWSKTPPTLNGRPIKVLAANGRHVTLEGAEVKGVFVALLKDARAWNETPGQQEASQRQFDSWLADMEYCDRF
jgi:hypothetical protein